MLPSHLEKAINAEFKRLEVGTETYSYSGLTAEVFSRGKTLVVKVYDDYSGSFYSPEVLTYLKGLPEGTPLDEIWNGLWDYQIFPNPEEV